MILAASVFEISCGKTDRQTSGGENRTQRLSSAWIKMTINPPKN